MIGRVLNRFFVNEIEAAAIIELVVWLGVLQMLHRLGAYYRA
jgi:hypothetical protein